MKIQEDATFIIIIQRRDLFFRDEKAFFTYRELKYEE